MNLLLHKPIIVVLKIIINRYAGTQVVECFFGSPFLHYSTDSDRDTDSHQLGGEVVVYHFRSEMYPLGENGAAYHLGQKWCATSCLAGRTAVVDMSPCRRRRCAALIASGVGGLALRASGVDGLT